jgi:hypothetical protein
MEGVDGILGIATEHDLKGIADGGIQRNDAEGGIQGIAGLGIAGDSGIQGIGGQRCALGRTSTTRGGESVA